MQQGRTLVLSVDRDDDIGFKANVASPVIGREACLSAATRLALADAEDSDVNAIFQAIRIYDDLKANGEDVEVAVVAGNHMHMIEGDRKIAASLGQVVKSTGSTNCIVVTDGAEDEFVVPVIQSQIPVTSIRRVVVNQIPNLEGTYYIIKKLFNDPKISRLVLVPLGLALLLWAITYLIGYPQVAAITVAAAIGIYLLYRGLGLDDLFKGFASALRTSLTRGKFSFVTYIAGILLVITGVALGLMNVLIFYVEVGYLLYFLIFMYGAVLWLALAGIVSSIGIIIDNFFYDRQGLAKVIVFPFFIGAVGLITYGASIYGLAVSHIPDFPYTTGTALQYIISGTLGGLICVFAGVGVQYLVNRYLVNARTPDKIIDSI
jgi:putative membrane protein